MYTLYVSFYIHFILSIVSSLGQQWYAYDVFNSNLLLCIFLLSGLDICFKVVLNRILVNFSLCMLINVMLIKAIVKSRYLAMSGVLLTIVFS